uniref:tRNA-specific adenosine deaminase 1 n=1 Tax=Anopheles farauti TaxID=69004 RepID=A0A182QBU2_9DIPT
METALANRISRECLSKFESLPKTGKPNASFEWTILSAIVLARAGDHGNDLRVVALGAGTKCLGADELRARGDRVNDSHAEVLARRAFLRYLLEQIENALGSEKESIFVRKNSKFALKEGCSFHFFTTHSPCGDGSIFEWQEREEAPPAKRTRTELPYPEPALVDDEHVGMTGGKLLQATPNDQTGDLMAQTTGCVRTKPGRGVRTLSVSCSDKLARWNVLGVQGALLMLLLDRPIYLESVVLCAGTDHSAEAIRRALWGRFDRWTEGENALKPPFRCVRPVIVAATDGVLFKYRKNRQPGADAGGKYQPSPCGIVWCDVAGRSHEVEVSGRRHGVTKRKLATPAARLQICKIELFTRFARAYDRVAGSARDLGVNNLVPVPEQRHPAGPGTPRDDKLNSGANGSPPVEGVTDIGKLSYASAKALSVEYAEQWTRVRVNMFEVWTKKPDALGEFFIDANTRN